MSLPIPRAVLMLVMAVALAAPVEALAAATTTPVRTGQQDPAESYEVLAEARAWDDVMDLAEQRLQEDPGDFAAVAWEGRASYEKSVLLSGGGEFSRDLGRALLHRSIELLGQAVAEGGDAIPQATWEWWYAARLQAGHDEALVPELEAAWTERGLAYAAFLRGWMAWEVLADPAQSGGVSRVPDEDVLLWLRRASDAQPSRSDFALVLAEALAARGDRDAASEVWDRAREGDADDEMLMGALLSILPGKDLAEPRLERLRLLSGDDGARVPAVAWAEAHALDQLGRSEEAERAFAEAAANGESSPEFARAHARLLIRLGRHDEALALMKSRAAARDWEAYSVVLDIADLLGLERRWDESQAAYEAALEIERRDERAARNRAITLWRAGRAEEASRAWREVLELLPGRADLINDAALSAAGAGDPMTERALLEEAAALPGSEDARENLAAWHLDHPSGRPEEAVRLLDQVLAVDPARDRALYLRFRAGRPR